METLSQQISRQLLLEDFTFSIVKWTNLVTDNKFVLNVM